MLDYIKMAHEHPLRAIVAVLAVGYLTLQLGLTTVNKAVARIEVQQEADVITGQRVLEMATTLARIDENVKSLKANQNIIINMKHKEESK